MNIKQKLELWQNNNLISAEQKQNILSFENKKSNNFAEFALLTISAVCFGIGLISIIAANWDKLSDTFKLIGYFALSIAISYGIYTTVINKANYKITEALLLLYAFDILAGIGLISQIYNLSSDSLSWALLWSILIIPLIFLSKTPILAFFWFYAFPISLFDCLKEIEFINHWIDLILDYIPENPALWLITAIYFYASCFFKQESKLFEGLRAWVYILLPSIFMALYTDFPAGSEKSVDWGQWSILGLCLALSAGFYYMPKAKEFRGTSIILGIFALFNIITNLIFVYAPAPQNMYQSNHPIYTLTQHFFSLAVLLTMLFRTIQLKRLNWAKIALAMVAIDIFVIYVDYSQTLLSTGLSMIGCSLVFLGLAYATSRGIKLINKYKD